MSSEIQSTDLVPQPAVAAGSDIGNGETSDHGLAVTVTDETTAGQDDQRLSKISQESHLEVEKEKGEKDEKDKNNDGKIQEIPLSGEPTFQPTLQPHVQVDKRTETDSPASLDPYTAMNPLLFLAEVACGSLQHEHEHETDAGPSNVSINDGITFFNRPKNVNDILYLLGQGVHVSYFTEHTVIGRNELYCYGKYILSEDGSWVLSENPCQGEPFSSKDIFDRHVKRKHFGMSTKKGTSYNLEQWAAEWGYTLEGGRDKVNWTYRINWDVAGSYPKLLSGVKEAPKEAKAKASTSKSKRPPKPKQVAGEVRVRKSSLKRPRRSE